MTVFFRQLQHLLPDARAWRVVKEKTLKKFLEGLAQKPADVRSFADSVHAELFPETTTHLAEWESQFGMFAAATDADRRTNLAAEWAATGGQSPRYIEDTLQAAGFDVYVHEWWSSGPSPYVARDPRLYTTQPLIGTFQCSAHSNQPECQTAGTYRQPQCDALLANDPGYLLNETLTREAPPPVPDDPATWPYFLYFGGATFGDLAYVPNARRMEFLRLVLKLVPTQNWKVIVVDYTTEGVFDDSFDSTFE